MHRIYFANLVLDPTTRTLANSDGMEVSLRPLPYDVFNLLIEKQGMHVTREELFETCWDGSVVTDQALTNVISSLRKQLTQLNAHDVTIKTVSKIGYLLEVNSDVKPIKQKVQVPELETVEPDTETQTNVVKDQKQDAKVRAFSFAPVLSILLVIGIASVLYFRPFVPHPDFLNDADYEHFSVSETDFYFYGLKHEELDLSDLAMHLQVKEFPICPAIIYLRISESAYEEGVHTLRAFAFAKNSNKSVNYINFSLDVDNLSKTILASMKRADAICR